MITTTRTLWINQRGSQVQNFLEYPLGTTLRFNLWKLRDAYGEQFNAGGIWRTDEPTLLVIAELQFGALTLPLGWLGCYWRGLTFSVSEHAALGTVVLNSFDDIAFICKSKLSLTPEFQAACQGF